ncbi:IS30 family transposase [Pseudogracilibacillus sp. SO30301A]|uniref:IS30 family transposase n=1 Tax=Pseudogracilibacillus sp. SO30301A TaxID=3098291 RepID=UPI00300DEECC
MVIPCIMLINYKKHIRRNTMSQLQFNPKSRKNKHLTERERYDIEIFIGVGLKPADIAKKLDRDKRTIEREITRGTVKQLNSDLTERYDYCADASQRIYYQNAANKGPGLKISNDHKLAQHIEKKIVKEKYSPGAVIGEIHAQELDFETTICTKTLYNYIDQEVFLNLTNKDLPVKKNKKKGSYKKVKIAHKNLKGTSIEKRPEEVEDRSIYGHWEMDCVVGKSGGSGAALLVLSERKSREEIIYKMQNQTQKSVIDVVNELERKYGKTFQETFKTITVDNGSEFLDFEGLEQSIHSTEMTRTKVYYAHPYSSWERGTNENSNKLIRRFIPKGTDINDFSDEEIAKIEDWMNNYPRGIFDYKTANDIARECREILNKREQAQA